MPQFNGGRSNNSQGGGQRRSGQGRPSDRRSDDRRGGEHRSDDRRGGERRGTERFNDDRRGGERRNDDRRGGDQRRSEYRGGANGSRGGYSSRNDSEGGYSRDERGGSSGRRGGWNGRRDEGRPDRRGEDRNRGRDSYRGDREGGRRSEGRYGRNDDRRDDRGYRGRDDRDDRRGGERREGGRGRGDDRQHANRGGANRAQHSGPQRTGYREERINNRINEPAVPADLDPKELDPSVRQELRSLAKDNADMVAKHLIMAATLLDENPEKALAHARAAKDRAGRVSVARETNGIAAYHAGEWKEAIAELRAARRMSGGPGLLAVLADAERGLGRPEKAIEVAHEEGVESLEPGSRAELAIVVAGAHQDLGDNDAALVSLQDALDIAEIPEVNLMRLFYAYADVLEHVGRKEEAIDWFQRSAQLDAGELMDTPERLKNLNAGQESE